MNKKFKGWQCNECKIFYPVNARPDICVCGNDMLVNSTKNTLIVYDEFSEKKRWIDNSKGNLEPELNFVNSELNEGGKTNANK